MFFSFKIDYSKELEDNLDALNKLVQNITNTRKKAFEESKIIILLSNILKLVEM